MSPESQPPGRTAATRSAGECFIAAGAAPMPNRASSGRRPSIGTSSASGKRSVSTARAVPSPSTSPSSAARAPVHTSPLNSSTSDASRPPPPGHHPAAEHLVQLVLQPAQPHDVFRLLGQERVEARLGLARGVEPPLDTDPLEQALEPEALADHSDRADDRRGVGVDLVRRAGEPVAAGRRDVFAEGEHRHVVLVGQARGCGRRRAPTAWASRPASSPAGRRRRAARARRRAPAPSPYSTELITDRGTGPVVGVITPCSLTRETTGWPSSPRRPGRRPGRRAASRSGRRSASM